MVQILVNMRLVQPLQPIEDPITSMVINSIGQTPIPQEMTKPIAAWVYDLTQRTTGSIVFNGTIISKEDVVNVAESM